MKLRKTLLAAAVVGLGLMASAGTASANTIPIDTGIAAWQVSNVNVLTPGGIGAIDGGAGYDVAGGPAVPITNANPGWTGGNPLVAAGAQWVGQSSNGGTNGIYADYTYSLTINNLVVGEVYALGASFTSDNYVSSVTWSNPGLITFNSPSGSNKIYDFQKTFTASGPTNGLTTSVTLNFVVHNESTLDKSDPGPSDAFKAENPTGFILHGTLESAGPAPSVPLPAAAWMGTVMLGGLGLLKLRRNRQLVD